MSRKLHIAAPTITALGCASACLIIALLADTARADYTLDRWYQMGDDILFGGSSNAENASNGAAVGSGNSFSQTLDGVSYTGVTYDSAATSNDTFQALVPFGTTGMPTYVEYGVGGNPAAPVASASSMNSFGIQFDGIDDYLRGINLNDPSINPGGTPAGFMTYDTIDRGMQLWVYPTAVDDVKDMVIDDGDEHGFNIAAGGNWQPEVRDDIPDSGVSAADAVNQWTHLAVIHDSYGLGGAISYINGLAVSSQNPIYDSASVTNLIIGANAEDDAGVTADPSTLGTPGFFTGIVDEVEMFALNDDDTDSYGTYDYTTDNGYFTDVWLPTQSGYGFTLDSSTGHNLQQWVKGDINFDGTFDQTDVDLFVANWLAERADLAGAGPQAGDYSTLALGDLDLDGDTDLGDWVKLRQYSLGASSAIVMPSLSQLNNPVPEPSTLCLAAAFGVALVQVTRHRRRIG